MSCHKNTPPHQFFAGDTVNFSHLIDSNLVGQVTAVAWVVTKGLQVLNFAGTISGDGTSVSFSVAPAGTVNAVPGLYRSNLIYTLANGGRVTKNTPGLRIYENPLAARTLSTLEQAYEANEATILALTQKINTSTSADGVSATKRSLTEALETRKQLLMAIDAENARKGRPTNGYNRIKKIEARF
jgi:hypothetical protein